MKPNLIVVLSAVAIVAISFISAFIEGASATQQDAAAVETSYAAR